MNRSTTIILRWFCYLLLLVLLIGLAVQTPPSFDEDQHVRYSQALIKAYSGIMSFDTAPLAEISQLADMRYYGGLSDIICGVAAQFLSGVDVFALRHAIYAIFGWLSIVLCGLTARLLGGFLMEGVAVVLLATTPMFIGHALMNPKDIAFACFYMLTIFACFHLLHSSQKERLSVRFFGIASIGIGGMLGIRVGGLIGFIPLGVSCFICCYREPRITKQCILGLAGTFIASITICTIFWPWLWVDPIQHFVEAYRYHSAFPIPIRLTFFGQSIDSTQLPWFYPVVMLAISLPEIHLVSLLWGLTQRKWDSNRGLLCVAAFFPILVAIGLGSVLYDGYRHFLFTLPPLAILAAFGVQRVRESFEGTIRNLFYGVIAIGLILPIRHIWDNPRYVYIYFNSFVGGVEQAYGTFDLDYWGLCVDEAIAKIVAENPTRDRIEIASNPYAEHLVQISRRNHPQIEVRPLDTDGVHLVFLLKGIERQHLINAMSTNQFQKVLLDGMPLCLYR